MTKLKRTFIMFSPDATTLIDCCFARNYFIESDIYTASFSSKYAIETEMTGSCFYETEVK